MFLPLIYKPCLYTPVQEAPVNEVMTRQLSRHDLSRLAVFNFRDFQQPIPMQYVTVVAYGLTVLGYPVTSVDVLAAAHLSLLEVTKYGASRLVIPQNVALEFGVPCMKQ